jgi:oxygen-dependent protoporphyrinogen oxidase
MTAHKGQPPRVAVVGSGACGVATAFDLQRRGFHVELLEREDRLGGRFGVSRLGDRPVMMGGKNIGRKYSAFREFTTALGDHPYEPFGINASRVKDGRVETFDSSRVRHSVGNLLRAGSVRDLRRLVGLALRLRRDEANRFLGSPLACGIARRNDHLPLSAHFGPDLARYLLRPMTVRMNGAEPDEVYLGTFNTNLALLMDTYDQLRFGIQPVLEALSRRVSVRLKAQVEGLVLRDGAVAGLRISEDGGPLSEVPYDAVVVATPAYAAGEILRATSPLLAGELEAVRYFPTTVVLVEYDRPVFTPEVRALALDEGPCSNAGAYGAEDRHIVRYTFSGRNARTPDPSQAQMDAWVDEGEATLHRYLPYGRHAKRVATVGRHWGRAYCGYLPFHGEFLHAVHREVGAVAGLELAGDYLRGVSIEACFRAGNEAAARVAGSMGAGAPVARLAPVEPRVAR